MTHSGLVRPLLAAVVLLAAVPFAVMPAPGLRAQQVTGAAVAGAQPRAGGAVGSCKAGASWRAPTVPWTEAEVARPRKNAPNCLRPGPSTISRSTRSRKEFAERRRRSCSNRSATTQKSRSIRRRLSPVRSRSGLGAWLKEVVQPDAKTLFGSQVIRLHNATSYACRNRYGAAEGLLSEHALANALRRLGVRARIGRAHDGARRLAARFGHAAAATAQAHRGSFKRSRPCRPLPPRPRGLGSSRWPRPRPVPSPRRRRWRRRLRQRSRRSTGRPTS